MTSTAVVWFRRDLRLGDQPTLLAAAATGSALAVFVLDDALLRPSGVPRRVFLYRCLRSLDDQLGGRLLVVRGDPVDVVPRVARSVGATAVHIAADQGPYGRRRDSAVADALDPGGVELVRTGSSYAVAPGRVLTGDGTGYRVFTPFRRAWERHGWRGPADTGASTVDWLDPADRSGGPTAVPIPDEPTEVSLPRAGEAAALDVWAEFRGSRLADYAADRDRPDRPGTSRMSPYLRWGCVHPRTLLASLDADSGASGASGGSRASGASRGSRAGGADAGDAFDAFRGELAWREFYADVLWHRPETARRNYDRRFDAMDHSQDEAAFDAWRAGRTGYPIVDAGMRQLLAEGWMHNRVRMIVASFLVKDLHLPWWLGARHFMRHLVDGDLASNQHGWQWTAGTGIDAAPYFRVFNPTVQGERFDPDGDYVRRYVPELRSVPGRAVHRLSTARPDGYPDPIVDHAVERDIALARYAAIR